MRCLFLVPNTGGTLNYVACARAAIEGLGIRYDLMRVSQAGTDYASISATYDFVMCVSQSDTAFRGFVDAATLTIPIFFPDAGNIAATAFSTIDQGITAVVTGYTLQFFSSPYSSSAWTAQTALWGTLGTGTALMTASATNPRTGAAQANAGMVASWYFSKAGGKHCYVHAGSFNTRPQIALLLQAAYNAGDFTASQMSSLNRLPVIIDMDHVTGQTSAPNSFNQSVTVLNRWLNKIPGNGVSWSGIPFNADASTPTFDAAVIAAYSANSGGKFSFVYHEHSTGREPTTGAWPYTARGGTLADAVTKVNQDTYYQDRKTKWNALGLNLPTPTYYVPGSNRWNEATLQLFSAETSVASDPNNASPKAGYGCKVCRISSNNGASRPGYSPQSNPRHSFRQREYMRGITLIPAVELGSGAALASDAAWEGKWQNILIGIHQGMALFFHDYDFVDTQNPVNALYGVELTGVLVDLGNYLTDVADFWTDPTRYAVGANL